MSSRLDDILGFTAIGLAITALVAAVILLVVFGVKEFNDWRRPTFELKKDDWTCTKEYEWYSSVRGVLVTHHDCIVWEKKK